MLLFCFNQWNEAERHFERSRNPSLCSFHKSEDFDIQQSPKWNQPSQWTGISKAWAPAAPPLCGRCAVCVLLWGTATCPSKMCLCHRPSELSWGLSFPIQLAGCRRAPTVCRGAVLLRAHSSDSGRRPFPLHLVYSDEEKSARQNVFSCDLVIVSKEKDAVYSES